MAAVSAKSMSTVVFLIVSPIIFLMAAFGALGVVYPELAFRIENIFQLRSVELSGLGIALHKIGGIFAVVVSVAFALRFGSIILLTAAVVGAAMPPLYFFWTRGMIIVQTMDGTVR